MYRTVKTHELVLKGIPDSLRAEIWLIFSGAVTEVLPDFSPKIFSFVASFFPCSHLLCCRDITHNVAEKC